MPAVEGQSEDDAVARAPRRRLQDQDRDGVLGLRAGGRRDLDLAEGRHVADQGPDGHDHGLARARRASRCPSSSGCSSRDAEAQLDKLGLTSDVTEQETTQPPGTVMEQDPPAGTRVDKGATVKLTVAKARPEVPDVTTDHPTEEEATATLEDAGFKVQVRTRPDPANVGRVERPVARGGHASLHRRDGDDLPRLGLRRHGDADRRRPSPSATPTP